MFQTSRIICCKNMVEIVPPHFFGCAQCARGGTQRFSQNGLKPLLNGTLICIQTYPKRFLDKLCQSGLYSDFKKSRRPKKIQKIHFLLVKIPNSENFTKGVGNLIACDIPFLKPLHLSKILVYITPHQLSNTLSKIFEKKNFYQ